MAAFEWAFNELASYGVLPWVAFLLITIGSVALLRVPGVFLGHALIAVLVLVLDVRWIQSEMDAPGWDGQPDQDAVFLIGVLIRIFLINTALMPLSLILLRTPRRVTGVEAEGGAPSV